MIFWKRGLRRFGMCAFVLMFSAKTFKKTSGNFTESRTQTSQNGVDYVPKLSS